MALGYASILADVNSLISVAAPAFTRVIRKEIVVVESDTLPLCLIVPDFQADAAESFEGQIHLDYRVGIALIFPGNQQLQTGLSNILDNRDKIRKNLHVTTLPTASVAGDPCGVFDCRLEMNPVYDISALDKNYDFTLMDFIYRSAELRN